ncbi:DNA polymerase delta catalytic subunit [Phytophthora megakarya]|uniref:DNA polymerase delta catalytic subunit n=1 Tax=Phytophthora megakarya TaxID=4795 RepID=A0A225WAJ3_9STRA|nr:DNA polymerase delta catalytic subunit [Phytophthora megakarya]
MLPRIASLLSGPDHKRKRETQEYEIQAAPVYSSTVYHHLEPRARDSRLNTDPPRRIPDERRLYYQRSDPQLEIFHETCSRYEDDENARYVYQCTEKPVPKQRRVHSPSLTLYEPEYGLSVLETRRYSARVETEAVASRSVPRVIYNRERNFRLSATETPVARITTPVHVAKRETPPLTTLVLKSKEFLKSKSLVRNRHDEIDWVATFLKVGFDPSSIYALMCPLRKGRWKSEEENYTMGLLRLIENGTILLRHGQSIRGYIGEKLHSDDMRVLKKLSNCKMFHFAKLINPRLAEEEKLDMSVAGAREGLDQLDQLKGEFLRSVQLEALVAVRKYLSDSSLRDLLNVRA